MRNLAFVCAAAAALIGAPTIAASGQAGHAPIAIDPITLAQVTIEVGKDKDRDRHGRWESRKRDRHARWESRKRDQHGRRESRRRKDKDHD
jgi:hypothetical protein